MKIRKYCFAVAVVGAVGLSFAIVAERYPSIYSFENVTWSDAGGWKVDQVQTFRPIIAEASGSTYTDSIGFDSVAGL